MPSASCAEDCQRASCVEDCQRVSYEQVEVMHYRTPHVFVYEVGVGVTATVNRLPA